MRKLRLALGAILLLGIPVALAGAQTSVPTVAVTATGGNITLEPSGPIAAGPTRFTFSGRGELSLATLRPGVTVDQLRRTLSRNPGSCAPPGLPRGVGPAEPGRHG